MRACLLRTQSNNTKDQFSNCGGELKAILAVMPVYVASDTSARLVFLFIRRNQVTSTER